MRITFTTSFRNSEADLNRAAEALAQRQREVSSGRRLHAPSDDPAAMAGSITERSALASIDHYARTTNSVLSRLTIVDSVLSDIVAKLTIARTAVLGAQGSIVTAPQREALASELEMVHDALRLSVNTVFRGQYLFSGTAADTLPYPIHPDGTTAAYQGNAQTSSLEVAQRVAVPISFDGDAILRGGAARNVLETLEDLIVAVRGGDQAAMTAGASELEAAFDRVQQALGRVGATLGALDDQRRELDTLRRITQGRISAHEDTNMAEAISGMTQAETAYRAALGAAAARGRLSLMDYLR